MCVYYRLYKHDYIYTLSVVYALFLMLQKHSSVFRVVVSDDKIINFVAAAY